MVLKMILRGEETFLLDSDFPQVKIYFQYNFRLIKPIFLCYILIVLNSISAT